MGFGLASSGLIQRMQLLEIKSSTRDVEIQSQMCVCVYIYVYDFRIIAFEQKLT